MSGEWTQWRGDKQRTGRAWVPLILFTGVDGDGLAEILAPCSDGYLYCLRGEG